MTKTWEWVHLNRLLLCSVTVMLVACRAVVTTVVGCASHISTHVGEYIYIPIYVHAAAAKSLQSCPTLCNPIDGSPSHSPVPGILQARIVEWVAIFFSNAWKWKVKVKSLSPIQLLATPWTAAYQAPLSMGFSRQEYWSGVPLPSPIYVHTCIHTYTHTYICIYQQWIYDSSN